MLETFQNYRYHRYLRYYSIPARVSKKKLPLPFAKLPLPTVTLFNLKPH